MALLSNLKQEDRFIGLFVSRSGDGKTSAACSFPGPIKVFDFDERIQGALGCPWLQPKLKDIDYTVFPPIEPKGTDPNYIRMNKMLEGLHGMPYDRFPYKTIILDSLTSTARALIRNAMPISNAGRKIGMMDMAGPGDYGFEAQGIDNILSFFRSLPVKNVIVTAHVIPKFAKPVIDGKVQQYMDNVEVGEKLSVRDKIGENSLIYFDHVFRFRREVIGTNKMKYEVIYRSDLAKTSFDKAPMSEDITGKDFYDQVLKKYMIQEPAPAVATR